MLFKSPIFASASGSIGGTTFSRNRGGMYTRDRAVPVNPNSTNQQAVRSAMAQLTSAWSNVLTATQRAEWDLYAANVPLINPLGDPVNVTGLNMYVRSNVPRIRAGATRVDDGPTNFTLADLAPITLTATALGAQLSIAFDDTAAWCDEDDAHLIVQDSIPKQETINFYKAPFNFAGTIDGDATTAPTSPVVVTSNHAFSTGQKMFVRGILTRADGRLSVAQIVSDVA